MNRVKPALVVLMLLVAALAVGKIFWEQELKYTKPTPVPVGYSIIPVNMVLELGIDSFRKSQKPRHLHFYNPHALAPNLTSHIILLW